MPEAGPPRTLEAVYTRQVPVLEICYGEQLGGAIVCSTAFGHAQVWVMGAAKLLDKIEDQRDARACRSWMSERLHLKLIEPLREPF